MDSAALDAFAATVCAAPAWSWDMNHQLATMLGRTVSPSDAFDSVFRLRPPGWRYGMGEDPEDPRLASLELYQWDGWQPRGCVVTANAATLLLGLVAVTARAYAAAARQSGWRSSGAVPAVGLQACVRTASFGGLAPIGTVLGITSANPPGHIASFVLSDGTITDDGNLCPVVPA